MWNRVKQTFRRKERVAPAPRQEAHIIAESEHRIRRSDISPNALRVLQQLHDAGFQACLVGGGVRDLLLGREPKDFDVATDATPEQVRGLFRNCRLIGRRFRLAHVHFGREIIEVATFRGSSNEDKVQESEDSGRLLRDNSFGTIDEDARRRDFSINALYYRISDNSVIDYADGLADLRAGRLRLLGEPGQRCREDPVRMLRAVRFATKLGFVIDSDCERAIFDCAPLLADVPAARLFEEVLKLFQGGVALETFERLRHYDLFRYLFTDTDAALAREEKDFPLTFVHCAMRNTDNRLQEGKGISPFFLFATLLWEPVRLRCDELVTEGTHPVPAMQQAANEILRRQIQQVSIPKRISLPVRDIWAAQFRFSQRNGKRPRQLLTHPRFRAAYDFLLLRAEAGEIDQELADWWTERVKQDPPRPTTQGARVEDATLADENDAVAGEADQAEPRGRRGNRRRRRRPGRKPVD